ncbi:MAG: ferrochelatase [Magnetococcales bacterium]|nr:ferrochelatase [Magnetococcales bacterium]
MTNITDHAILKPISFHIKDTKLLPSPTIGVLLTQLGTPDAPEPIAVRRFLREFLSDKRVVDLPRWFWLPLLHGVILPTRSRRSAALYQTIWRSDGRSPLLHYSLATTDGVRQRLGKDVEVHLAMRYGQPNIANALHTMTAAGIQRILIFPLFPQYSSAATASIFDAVYQTFASSRFLPTLRFAAPFFNAPSYISALAATIRTVADPDKPMDWLFSFHGLPTRFVTEGDPYQDQCIETTRLLVKELALPDTRWQMSFQSRFGREPWLKPNTDGMLKQLPGQGKQNLVVVCPGFSADCLETLEEIAHQGKENFLQAGGKQFIYAPCLNDTNVWLDALTGLIEQEISGWR